MSDSKLKLVPNEIFLAKERDISSDDFILGNAIRLLFPNRYLIIGQRNKISNLSLADVARPKNRRGLEMLAEIVKNSFDKHEELTVVYDPNYKFSFEIYYGRRKVIATPLGNLNPLVAVGYNPDKFTYAWSSHQTGVLFKEAARFADMISEMRNKETKVKFYDLI